MTTDIAGGNTPTKHAKPELDDINVSEDEGQGHWYHSLSGSEKRFHILFYALAGLTGVLVVQLIWQIAVLTAR